MILFKKLRYQNLLSTGNQFTELEFTKSKSTLVVGQNGAGKCVEKTTLINLRDKETGEIFSCHIGDFFDAQSKFQTKLK